LENNCIIRILINSIVTVGKLGLLYLDGANFKVWNVGIANVYVRKEFSSIW
jgi:hypothetical protein